MPPLSLLIKPASSACNLACRYCFYRDEACRRQVRDYGPMSQDTARWVIRRALEEAQGDCTFAFQGGEPLLAGLDFFRFFLAEARRLSQGRLRLHWAVQTNGTLLNPQWAAFFAENQVLVGLSLDGPRELHDLHRPAPNGEGSFDRAVRGLSLLQSQGVMVNALSVVTPQSARKARSVYRFLRGRGLEYLQFIPCLPPLEQEGKGGRWELSPEQYGEFLMELYRVFCESREKGERVSVRYFDNLFSLLQGCPAESCGMTGRCTCQNLVEADGSVYPCDFYALDCWRLGRVQEQSFAQMARSQPALRFYQRSLSHSPQCDQCRYFPLCGAGCFRERADGKNRWCEGLRAFFALAVG